MANRYADYLKALRQPVRKLCRLRFLQPDGSTAFTMDNNAKSLRAGAFIADGTITGNRQNGTRRTATVKLVNLDGEYDYNVNQVWFGQEIALDEGLILPDGTDYYIQQGIFLIKNPVESVLPSGRTATYSLTDKWAYLDGTLGGNLNAAHVVDYGTNIYMPIRSLLAEGRGNGYPIDRVTPIFTEYYNGKTQTLPDGTVVSVTNAPYTQTIEADGGTIALVILGLGSMLNALVGYDETGALRIDPSQDDISDLSKPVLWDFSFSDVTLLGPTYTVKNTEVYNEFIVVGEGLDGSAQPWGLARNLDIRSDTNVMTIGTKRKWLSLPDYWTRQQCEDRAVWELKRASVLQRAVDISCTQMFHIRGNDLVTIARTDKPGNPVERHLVMGFSRPLVGNKPMTISATSVLDFPNATVTGGP